MNYMTWNMRAIHILGKEVEQLWKVQRKKVRLCDGYNGVD